MWGSSCRRVRVPALLLGSSWSRASTGSGHPDGVSYLWRTPGSVAGVVVVVFSFDLGSPVGSGPYSEVVQYRDNPWLGRGKPLFHSPVPKISLIYELLNEQRIRY